MPPEVMRLIEALATAAIFILILPKRSWRSLGPRFGDLMTGRRTSLFEPPRRRQGRLPRQLQVELRRIFELGVPVFVAARIAERRARATHEVEEAAWRTSSSAVILDLLQRTVDEAEALRRLEASGLPSPAAKAEPAARAPRSAIPLEWFVRHEPPVVASNGKGSQADHVESASDDRMLGLEVRTLGGLTLSDSSEDLTPALLRSRLHSFIWLYLLMRAIATPRTRVSRGEMADELTPGLNPEKQRKRLRDRLSDLLAELPPPLTSPIRVEDDLLRFDLEASSVDLVTLLDLARECSARDGLMSEALAAEVQAALRAAEGEFLPGWDEIEREVTGGRGTSSDLVRDLRSQAEDARVALLAALAADRIARRDAGHAIPLLEQALERRPDREDLALDLRAAYLETGQVGRAAALQREYSLEPRP